MPSDPGSLDDKPRCNARTSQFSRFTSPEYKIHKKCRASCSLRSFQTFAVTKSKLLALAKQFCAPLCRTQKKATSIEKEFIANDQTLLAAERIMLDKKISTDPDLLLILIKFNKSMMQKLDRFQLFFFKNAVLYLFFVTILNLIIVM